jgi:hypothetical protein
VIYRACLGALRASLTQLTVEGSTYVLLLRDTTDPCLYTLFSDQEGLLYAGVPLQ